MARAGGRPPLRIADGGRRSDSADHWREQRHRRRHRPGRRQLASAGAGEDAVQKLALVEVNEVMVMPARQPG
jgi:hypothetical protein